ncbi:FixH family protein [Umezawaea beigongshangensis]|uniref:FixH family protein n=1 Tax=Umezawaea beigongshangensis TaxID=2780383 RepID=UPI0018F138D3|nr:FixH family protein [Umezawaea beigongshangensis]
MTRRWMRAAPVAALLVAVVVAAAVVLFARPGSGSAPAALEAATSRHGVRLVVDAARAGTTGVDVEVSGAPDVDEVRIEPAMPHMGHALPPIPAQRTGDGRYRAAEVPLDMAGQWELTVVVDDARGAERVVFPLLISG